MRRQLLALAFLLCATSAQAEVIVSITAGAYRLDGGTHTVTMPFDTEYGIRLSNNDKRRALVHIKIDGRKSTSDGLILRANETIILERFVDNGDLKRGPKFKFIDAYDRPTGRPEHADDGKVSVSIQYEKNNDPLVRYGGEANFSNSWGSDTISWSHSAVTTSSLGHIQTDILTPTASQTSPGITVEGSESRQRFEAAKLGDMEPRIDTLEIKLIGYHKQPPLLMRVP